MIHGNLARLITHVPGNRNMMIIICHESVPVARGHISALQNHLLDLDMDLLRQYLRFLVKCQRENPVFQACFHI